MTERRQGPLDGVRVVELAGIGPAPFACMALADMGADVVRVDRPGGAELSAAPPERDVLNRGKRSVVLDLKDPEAVAIVRALVARADVLVEGFRPGVAERLGLGPEVLCGENARLVYVRMTGWGQSGPLATHAGHEIDYLAVTGILHALGPAGGRPVVPFPIIGDYAGGGMYAVAGVLAALVEARATGRGQVVDVAMVDGAAHLLSATLSMLSAGRWVDRRGVNMLDGGSPFYDVYETADGRLVAVGALEGRFFAELLRLLEVPPETFPAEAQYDTARWGELRAVLTGVFRSRTQAEWTAVFSGTDACVAPVLSLREAEAAPHLRARGSLVEHDGVLQPGPAPRFGNHEPGPPGRPPRPGQHTREVLTELGVDPEPWVSSAP